MRSDWGKALLGAILGSLAGGAVVAAATGDTTIHACVQNGTGAIAILSDPTGYTNPQGTTCQSSSLTSQVHPLDWAQQGPPGAPGAPGTPGTPGQAGADASILFARVGAAGGVQDSSGGVRADRVQKGYYVVSFPGDDTGCAPTAIPLTGKLSLAHDAAAGETIPLIEPDSVRYIASQAITEFGLPELDASGKDAAALTLKTPSKGIPFTLTLTCPPH